MIPKDIIQLEKERHWEMRALMVLTMTLILETNEDGQIRKEKLLQVITSYKYSEGKCTRWKETYLKTRVSASRCFDEPIGNPCDLDVIDLLMTYVL